MRKIERGGAWGLVIASRGEREKNLGKEAEKKERSWVVLRPAGDEKCVLKGGEERMPLPKHQLTGQGILKHIRTEGGSMKIKSGRGG